jgi:hypothetical protein
MKGLKSQCINEHFHNTICFREAQDLAPMRFVMLIGFNSGWTVSTTTTESFVSNDQNADQASYLPR